MSAAPALPLFDERRDPGQGTSVVLALMVHLLLLAVLFVGVRWQNRPPQSVVVELWSEPPPVQAQPKPEPKPEPKVEPPPAPKPEPVIEKPDIAIKEPVKPKPVPEVKPRPVPEVAKPLPKPAPKPAAQAEPPKPRVDEAAKRMREELAREQANIAVERERRAIRDQLARESASANARALDEYVGRIRAKVRGNWILPQDLAGNPEAVFSVVQLPTGEVLQVKLVRSSGIGAYDAAVERAILKSSPLPRPDRPELFSRELRLTFRPKD
jgi:colicin import membrane protein